MAVESVDEYVGKQKSPQKEICEKLRSIILKTFPGITEELRFGVPWYGKYYIVALKNHVNLGFSVSGLSEKEKNMFEGKGKLMRHLKFFSPEDVDGKKVAELLRIVDKKAKCDCVC